MRRRREANQLNSAGRVLGGKGRRHLILLGCLIVTLSIGSCRSEDLANLLGQSQLTPQQQQDLTTRIEQLIRDYMPGTKFTTSDEEAISLPGEMVPKSPGEPSIPSPRNDDNKPKLMSVQPIGFQFPDFLSQERSGAIRAYKLFPNYQLFSPYDLERLDAYLFPIEQYVTSFRHEELEKTDKICKKVREYSNAVMKKRYNYDVWSNLLGDIEIELSALKKLPVGISIPIRTSLLDDMVSSFVILNLIPKETKFLSRDLQMLVKEEKIVG